MRLTVAQQVMVEENRWLVPYVIRLAYKMPSRHADYDDAVSVGAIGLAKAVCGYDASYKTTFGTYAFWKIRGEVTGLLRQLRKQRGGGVIEFDPDAEVPRPVSMGRDYERMKGGVATMCAGLNEQQQWVMQRHYFDGWAFQAIGDEMGLCRQRAQQIHKAALGVLREQWPGAERWLEVA